MNAIYVCPGYHWTNLDDDEPVQVPGTTDPLNEGWVLMQTKPNRFIIGRDKVWLCPACAKRYLGERDDG